jgi:low molecular weight phosphotyrosine protein phosphatase
MDFEKFDYIFAMDQSNLLDLKHLQQQKPTGKAKVKIFGEYSGGKMEEVEDLCGENKYFEMVYGQFMLFSKNFLKEIFPYVDA